MDITLKQAEQFIPTLLKNNIVPFLHSSPAIGKSSLAKQVAKKFGLKVIDLRLTELDSSDLHGLPNFLNGKAEFVPFNTFPLEGDKIPDGYKGWCILLDEFNSAIHSVQAAAYKLVLDRQVGQHKLHDKVAIIAAGNLDTDNAITNVMSSALVSRFAHFNIRYDNEEWLAWANESGIDFRITSYIGFKPRDLYTFNPDSIEPYAAPRTWEMLSKVIKDTELTNEHLPLVSSLIGEGVARSFLTYTKLFSELPTYKEIIANPKTVNLSDNLGTQWAIMGMVCHHIDKATAKVASEFLSRLPSELQVCAVRELRVRVPALLTTEMRDWSISLAKEVF